MKKRIPYPKPDSLHEYYVFRYPPCVASSLLVLHVNDHPAHTILSNKAKFTALLTTYSPSNILIVSNSSGTLSKDPLGTAADALERNTGVKVLRHSQMKPACGEEIMAHFLAQPRGSYSDRDGDGKQGSRKDEKQVRGREVTKPSQVCVVGDRLFTDVVMANMMGARAIWIKNGVVQDHGFVTRLEYGIEGWLRRRGWMAKDVSS